MGIAEAALMFGGSIGLDKVFWFFRVCATGQHAHHLDGLDFVESMGVKRVELFHAEAADQGLHVLVLGYVFHFPLVKGAAQYGFFMHDAQVGMARVGFQLFVKLHHRVPLSFKALKKRAASIIKSAHQIALAIVAAGRLQDF